MTSGQFGLREAKVVGRYLTQAQLTHSLVKHTNPKRERGSRHDSPSLTLRVGVSRVGVSINREQYLIGWEDFAWRGFPRTD